MPVFAAKIWKTEIWHLTCDNFSLGWKGGGGHILWPEEVKRSSPFFANLCLAYR